MGGAVMNRAYGSTGTSDEPLKSTNGALHTDNKGTLAESYKFQDGNTLVASATYDTADVSLFLPFDALRMTEDGGVASVTWSIQLRPGSKGVLVVSGTGTLSVKGVIDAVATANITVSTTAGVLQAATTLAAGTYFIEA